MPSLTEACAAAVREANFRGKLLSVTQLQHEDLLLSSCGTRAENMEVAVLYKQHPCVLM